MAGKVGGIFIDFFARTANFDAAMGRVRKQLTRVRADFKRLAGRLINVRSAFATLAGSAGIGLLVKNQMAVIDSLAKTSDKLGIATEALGGFQYAAQLNGIAVKTFDMGLQRMTRRVAEAGKGTGEAVKALKELGLNAVNLATLAPEEQFKQIADAMNKVGSQGDRVRLAMKLFDSEGVALVNILRLGSNGLEQMIKEAERLGIALNRIDAAKIEDANNSITAAKGVMTGMVNLLAVQLSPVIAGVAKDFTKAATGVDDLNESMGVWVTNVVTGVGWIKNIFYGWQLLIKGSTLLLAKEAELIAKLYLKVLTFIDDAAQKGVDKLNGYIEALNALSFYSLNLPTIKIKGAGDEIIYLEEIVKGLGEEVGKLNLEWAELINAGLPSDNIGKWLEKARKDSQAIAENIADMKTIEAVGDLGPGKVDILFDDMKIEEVIKKTDKLNDAAKELGLTFSSAFEEAVIGGGNLGDVLRGLGQDILKMVLRMTVTAPLANMVSGIFGNIFGGFRASGGPVSRGKSYVVGEQGPELFTPSAMGGFITPNGSGSMDGVTVNQVNHFESGVTAQDIGQMIPKIIEATKSAIVEERIRGGRFARAMG